MKATRPVRLMNRIGTRAVLLAKQGISSAVYQFWLVLRRSPAKGALQKAVGYFPPVQAKLHRIVRRELGREPPLARAKLLGLHQPSTLAHAGPSCARPLGIEEILARVEREVVDVPMRLGND